MPGETETIITNSVTIDTPASDAGIYSTSNGGIADLGTDGANTLSGTDGNDIIVGEKGDDTIIQNVGDGDDILIGGRVFDTTSGGPSPTTTTHVDSSGSNNYVFNFNVTTTQGVDLTFRDGDTPNYTANLQAWNNYQAQLEAWREALIQQYGADADTTEQSTDVYTSATRSKPSTYVTTEIYDNTFHVDGQTTIQGDGNDKILGFDGNDTITLAGLTSEQFAQFATHEVSDGNTIIHIGDSSITVLGVTDWSAVSAQIVFA